MYAATLNRFVDVGTKLGRWTAVISRAQNAYQLTATLNVTIGASTSIAKRERWFGYLELTRCVRVYLSIEWCSGWPAVAVAVHVHGTRAEQHCVLRHCEPQLEPSEPRCHDHCDTRQSLMGTMRCTSAYRGALVTDAPR